MPTGYHISEVPSISSKFKNSDQSWKNIHALKSKSKKFVRFKSDEIEDSSNQKSSSVHSLFNDSTICSENDVTVLSCHIAKLKKWLLGVEDFDAIDFEKIIKSVELMELHLSDDVNLNKSSFFLSNSEILIMNKELDSDFSDDDDNDDENNHHDRELEIRENKQKQSIDISSARIRSNCSLSLSGCNPGHLKMKIMKSHKNKQTESAKVCEDKIQSDCEDVEELLDERLI
ncbi:hypothetical protein HELRODRAFT_164382 [Helobdella robusta]|uniref:Uncharacterized protein n=1 Tax=Helobdella robusta TaxID=6412 RepID=T1EVC8_HELRO|nr:hypothetical protein HELRODRAFT_164382 [Helobdella robusta]ESN94526.1 hypothetical protein HELRODRAFT_164382 [Helobdella robusta]